MIRLVLVITVTWLFVLGTARSSIACDCETVVPGSVLSRASLMFIGRAESMNWTEGTQAYEILGVLKGKPDSPTRHMVRFGRGDEIDNCMSIEPEGSVAFVAYTRGPPSICDGSGGLHGYSQDVGQYFEEAGAKPRVLSEAGVKAMLAPYLRGRKGPVYFVGAGPIGKTLQIAGRQVMFIDVLDGLPARAEILQVGRVLGLGDLVFVEIQGKPLPLLRAIVKQPGKGPATLVWAFSRGGRLRIPEPK